MNTLELAQAKDIEICYEIIDMGRSFQKAQGFTQWTDDYPSMDTLREDVRAQKGFVLKVDGRIAGYMCIDFDGEPAYEHIRGCWQTEEPYAVVHRMALHADFRGVGLADETFRLIGQLCLSRNIKSIRADTDFPNHRMQHILNKNGFVNCGVIVFQGGEKLAYERSL